MNTIEQIYAENSMMTVHLMLTIFTAIFLFTAFFAFRFFKLSIVISAAVAGYEFGAVTLGVAFGDGINGFDAAMVVGIACAVILAILSFRLYKLSIYVFGGLVSAALVAAIAQPVLESATDLPELAVSWIVLFVSAMAAFIGGTLYYKAYKVIYIISTSVFGMFMTLGCIAMLVSTNEYVIGSMALIGIILSYPAIKYQFKINQGRSIDL